MDGWIKLHRTLLLSRQFQDPNECKIWIWMLLKASIGDRYVTLKTGKGTQVVTVKRGQFIFGRNIAEQELKINGSTIYRAIQRMAEDGCIIVEPNSHYSIITISKYNDYQDNTDFEDFEIIESEQAMNSQRTGNEQPMSSQRSGNEQAMNNQRTQYKNVLEGKEGIEGLEGKKVKKEKAAASPCPPFYPEFMKAYFDFFKARNGGSPRITKQDGEGLKAIIFFMRAQVKVLRPNCSEDEIGPHSVKGFSWILSNWGTLSNYHQQKISLCAMASEINPIYDHLKKQSDGKKHAKDVTVSDLARAANQYVNGNGK